MHGSFSSNTAWALSLRSAADALILALYNHFSGQRSCASPAIQYLQLIPSTLRQFGKVPEVM